MSYSRTQTTRVGAGGVSFGRQQMPEQGSNCCCRGAGGASQTPALRHRCLCTFDVQGSCWRFKCTHVCKPAHCWRRFSNELFRTALWCCACSRPTDCCSSLPCQVAETQEEVQDSRTGQSSVTHTRRLGDKVRPGPGCTFMPGMHSVHCRGTATPHLVVCSVRHIYPARTEGKPPSPSSNSPSHPAAAAGGCNGSLG